MPKLTKAVTDAIPWRILLPRPRYFRSLRVARVCPEIVGEQNRIALYTWCEAITMGSVVVVASPLLLIMWLGSVFERIRLPLPDFNALRRKALEEAWAKVPLDEIKRRLGETTPHIVTKKPALDSTDPR